MARRNGPKQSLATHMATIKQLREMTREEAQKRTCGTCQITYTDASYAAECNRWHNGD